MVGSLLLLVSLWMHIHSGCCLFDDITLYRIHVVVEIVVDSSFIGF